MERCPAGGGGGAAWRVRRPSQYTIYKHAVQKNVRESLRGLRALELNRDTSAELGAASGWGGGHINPDSAIIGGSTHTPTRTCTALASQLCKMKEFLKGIIKIRGQLSKNAGEDRTFCMGRDKSNYYGTITGSITSHVMPAARSDQVYNNHWASIPERKRSPEVIIPSNFIIGRLKFDKKLKLSEIKLRPTARQD